VLIGSCLNPPGREGEKEKETGGVVILNAKTIPSSNRCRESLDISAAVFVVHVASARCAISNYLPVYTDGMHEQFLFRPVRNAPPATRTSLHEQQRCPSCRHYAVKLTFRVSPLKKKKPIHSTSRMKIRRMKK